MRSLLLYNLYPKNNWRQVTQSILKSVPLHDDIIVNITLDRKDRFIKKHKYITWYLKRYPKIKKIIFSLNNPALGEVPAFDNLRKEINYDFYEVVTYTHSKGVTKPKNKNIQDWVKMMTYFLIERHDLCIKAFNDGYALYGTQLNEYNYNQIRQKTYKYCDFWYAGTFFSVNLKLLRKEFISTNCPENYYGVEAFPGNLCSKHLAYCAHKSPFSLYDKPYPEANYKNLNMEKNSILFIIPRTPHHLRTPLRDMLWENTKKSLFNQTYHNWQALVIDDQDLIDGNLQYIASTAVRKSEKIQHALKIVESWENKPDYVIRLDDDDLIAPNALSYINDKNFDVAVDEYHTFFELKSGFFCQTRRTWFANTIIHKYEHAKSIMPDGRPLLDQDHSHVWHNYYSGKQIYKLPKEMPLYLRILSPGTVTSQQDDDYLNYVLSFGSWKKNLSLQKYFNSELFKRPIDHVFRLKMKLHPSAIKQMLKAILNSAQ